MPLKVLHVVPEIDEASGVCRVARLLAREAGGELIACSDCSVARLRDGAYDEVWVHGMWLPREWRACFAVLSLTHDAGTRPRLVRMTHGSLSPVYLERQGKWKKRLAGPVERWLFSKTDRVVVTCEAEKAWVREYLGLGDCSDCSDCSIVKNQPAIEVVDLKRFFRLEEWEEKKVTVEYGDQKRSLHLLYLGRRHPLKGVEFLERAVAQLQSEQSNNSNNRTIELRVVSDHFGAELERDWEWCDVLCLPTLSENFGLVVAEALERGKRVIVTDGAPAWGEGLFDCSACSDCSIEKGFGGRLMYLRGYREGTDDERVALLKEAMGKLKGGLEGSR